MPGFDGRCLPFVPIIGSNNTLRPQPEQQFLQRLTQFRHIQSLRLEEERIRGLHEVMTEAEQQMKIASLIAGVLTLFVLIFQWLLYIWSPTFSGLVIIIMKVVIWFSVAIIFVLVVWIVGGYFLHEGHKKEVIHSKNRIQRLQRYLILGPMFQLDRIEETSSHEHSTSSAGLNDFTSDQFGGSNWRLNLAAINVYMKHLFERFCSTFRRGKRQTTNITEVSDFDQASWNERFLQRSVRPNMTSYSKPINQDISTRMFTTQFEDHCSVIRHHIPEVRPIDSSTIHTSADFSGSDSSRRSLMSL